MHYSPIPSNYSNYVPPSVIKTGQLLVSNRSLENINCILPVLFNRGALYLGDVVSTLKTQILEKHQIKAILTCMIEPISRLNQNILLHKILPLRDNLEFPIGQYFNQAKHFIDQARSKGLNVLVHCHAGVSRSAAVVCAYLMHQNVWNTQAALQFVRQKRYRAKPNANFMNQLNFFWENQVKNLHQNTKKNHTNERILPIKQQKTILITLDQQIETHDELFQIDQRKKLLKQKNSNVRVNTERNQKNSSKLYDQSVKQVNSQKKQRRIFKTVRGQQEQKNPSFVYENDNFQANKSQIYFNKAFDPKLARSNVEIKNIEPIRPIQKQSIHTLQNKSYLMGEGRNSIEFKPQQVNKSLNGSIVKIKECITPIKQKRDVQSDRIVFNNQYNRESNGISHGRASNGIQYDRTPNGIVINYGQQTPKNYSRYSLTGQRTSYKQCY